MARAQALLQRQAISRSRAGGPNAAAPSVSRAGVPRYLAAVQRACSVCDATPENSTAQPPGAVAGEAGRGGTPPASPPRHGRREAGEPAHANANANVHATAAAGVARAERPLPGAARIQSAFGRHDVQGVRTQVGGPAAAASQALGARAYTVGPRIGFHAEPDLRLAAHEAAHVVQQRQGVQLKGGVGQAGDRYEQQADAVAERVVAGRTAEDLLDATPARGDDAPAPAYQPQCAGGVFCGSACGDGSAAAVAPDDATGAPPPAAVQRDLVADTERVIVAPAAGGADVAAGGIARGSAPVTGRAAGSTAAPAGAGPADAAGDAVVEAGAGGATAAAAALSPRRGAGAASGPGSAAAAETGASADALGASGVGPAPSAGAGASTGPSASDASAAGVAGTADASPAAADVAGHGAAAEATSFGAGATTPSGAEGAGAAAASTGPAATESAGPADAAGSGAATAVAAAGGCGSLASPCYRAGIEEPDPAPEEQPADPEAGTAAESHGADSPDIEGADDCPLGSAVAEAGAAADTGAAAQAATSAVPAMTAGTVSEGAGAAGAAPSAGHGAMPGAGAGPAAGGGPGPGGGSAGGAGAGATPAAEGGAAGAALVSAIDTTRSQRDGSVVAYAGSRQRLREAAAGTAAVAAPLATAGLDGGARTIAARADGLFAHVRSGVDGVAGGALGALADRLGARAEAIKADIDAAVAAEQATVSARVSRARSRARAQAGAAHGRIAGAHAAATARLQAAAEAALAVLEASSDDALARIDTTEAEGLDGITTLYANSHDQHLAIGRTVGAEAVARGGAYVDAYEGCKIHERDSWTAGYLTDRRAEAQQNAARETAEGYRASLEQAAADQAAHLHPGRRNDRCGLRATATQAREAVSQQHQAMVTALANGLQAGLDQAGASRDALHQAIDGALADTLAALARQAHDQRQAAADTGTLQRLAVEQAVHGASATLMGALADAIGAVGGLLGPARNAMAGLADAEPAAATARLADLDAALQAGLARLSIQADSGATQAEQRLADSGSVAQAAMGQLAAGHADQTRQHGEGFGLAMRQLAQAAAQALGELAAQQAAQSRSLADDGAATFDDVATGFNEAAETMLGNIADTLAESESALEASLHQSLVAIDRDIPQHACEAASHEQPAWKSVVKWVLIIAIVVVVALVIGPAVIGAVGAAAGALGASAAVAGVVGAVVGGAIVGAATSGVIQVVNNWAAGEDLTAGLGRAMVMGAIGGAFGGAAGQLLGRAVQAYQLSGAMQFTLNLASDMVLEIGTELVTGEFSWEALGMAALMTVATGGFGEIPRVRRIQARVQHGVAARVPGRGAARFADSVRPPAAAATGPGPARTGPESAAAAAAPHAPVAEGPTPRGAAGEPGVAAPRAAAAEGGPARAPETAPARPAEPGPARPTQPDPAEPTGPRATEPEGSHRHDDVDGAAGRSETRPAGEADTARPARELTDGELVETTAARTQVGDEPHVVAMRRNGDRVECEVCSLGCGRLRDRMQAMEDALPATPQHRPMRRALADLRARVTKVEAAIEAGSLRHADAIRASADIAARMRVIGADYPSVGKGIDRPRPAADTYDLSTGAKTGHEPVRTDNLPGANTRPRQEVSVRDAASLKLRNGMDAIYVLRDADTGAILKVGKTVGGDRAARRFETYRRAGDDLGLNLRLEVTPVAKTRGGVKVEAHESALRARLEREGHVMPWDNSPEHGPRRAAGEAMPDPGAPQFRQGRMGRVGPGTPGDARRAALRASHDWREGWLVPRLPN